MTKTSIRLTGRRSLPQSAFSFDWNDTSSGSVCFLDILDKSQVQNFPPDSRIQVMLSENKSVHFADFGTLENMNSSVSFDGVSWVSPSVELRIAHHGTDRNHLLLGSTKLPKSNNSGDTEGILHFQKRETSPFLWELSVEEDAFPTPFLNEKMEGKVDPIIWVKSNSIFLLSVFPTVIEKVFQKIFETDGKLDEGWMHLWALWAEKTMGCDKFPNGSDPDDFSTWVNNEKSTIPVKNGSPAGRIGNPCGSGGGEMTFDNLYQFTPLGMERFKAFFKGDISADQIDSTDLSVATPVQG